MRRRQFVTSASATIAVASIAGCSGILGDDDGSSGPEGAVEAYVDAIDGNDPSEVEAAIHPDAPRSSDAVPSESELEAISASVESTEVVEEPEDGQAVVEAEVEITIEMMGQEQSQTETSTFDVREHEGEWKVYGEQ